MVSRLTRLGSRKACLRWPSVSGSSASARGKGEGEWGGRGVEGFGWPAKEPFVNRPGNVTEGAAGLVPKERKMTSLLEAVHASRMGRYSEPFPPDHSKDR
jgi:hypothetical protein